MIMEKMYHFGQNSKAFFGSADTCPLGKGSGKWPSRPMFYEVLADEPSPEMGVMN
jgi:hypothetical protein